MQLRSLKGYLLSHCSQRTEQLHSPLFAAIYFFSATVHSDQKPKCNTDHHMFSDVQQLTIPTGLKWLSTF